jgi:hypothetical protein
MTTRDKVAKALNEGHGVGEVADLVGVHRNTVSYHKRGLGAVETESSQEYRAEILLKLADIESLVSDPSIDKIDKAKVLLDVVKQLRAVYGTDAPTKSVSASFSASSDPLYLDFKKATSGLGDAQVGEVLKFAAALPRMSEPIDATWFPKEEEKSDDPA